MVITEAAILVFVLIKQYKVMGRKLVLKSKIIL